MCGALCDNPISAPRRDQQDEMEFVSSSKDDSMHERGEVSRLGIRIRCIIESGTL
jgi:hypothetical protein